jgi:DNA topoisomerase-1
MASGEVLLCVSLKVYLKGHDDDEEEQEGMLPAMKVNENYKIITLLRQRYSCCCKIY